MSETIHVSVAWPYANGDMHIGHLAGAYLPPDIFARYHRLKGNRVLMVSGSDSHGTPITVTAEQQNLTPREVFEKYHARFLDAQKAIGISYDLFTHTDTENHHRIAQDIFLMLLDRGFLYEETQDLLYDEEADRFLPDRMVEGECYLCGYENARGDQCDNCGNLMDSTRLINPRSKLSGNTPIVKRTNHYFLDLAKAKDGLRAYLNDEKDHWRPNVLKFAQNMVEDLRGRPITRDISWGVPVPLEGWDEKRLYVWFEAVIGYLSASIEWAEHQGEPDLWKEWWYNPDTKMYCFIGKDNIPFHTVIWPAELMGLKGLYDSQDRDLVLPYDVPSNEYLNVQGAQFSKSRNWAVWLYDMLERYDPDAIRYYVASVFPETRDSDFTWEDFVTRNNTELVAWWGNLVNRVLKFAAKNWDGKVPEPHTLGAKDEALLGEIVEGFDTVGTYLAEVKLRKALEEAMRLVREVNVYLDQSPWFGVIKEDKEAAARTVYTAMQAINYLKTILAPFLPFTSQALHEILGFDGDLFGKQVIKNYEEATRNHLVLEYEAKEMRGQWRPETLPPGQKLGEVRPLFTKLDPSVIEEETERMG